VIASGPTSETASTPREAISALRELGLLDAPELTSVARYLREKQQQPPAQIAAPPVRIAPHVTNLLIGNNALAVDAAGAEAEQMGCSHAMISAAEPEGSAEETGRHLAEMAKRMRHEAGPDCLISGGEPTVKLADESIRGRGGRNQQLALAALQQLGDCAGIALLAGGTDGEDGPTDAAGAVVTAGIVNAARGQQLDAADFLRRNDAYHFFAATGGLFKTGPTQTNVCDLRILLVDR
jgi:glycerate-2-kinase